MLEIFRAVSPEDSSDAGHFGAWQRPHPSREPRWFWPLQHATKHLPSRAIFGGDENSRIRDLICCMFHFEGFIMCNIHQRHQFGWLLMAFSKKLQELWGCIGFAEKAEVPSGRKHVRELHFTKVAAIFGSETGSSLRHCHC